MRVLAFIEPCLPSPADRPPSGPDWIHEIKLDGFRMIVRRDPAGVRLLHAQRPRLDRPLPLIAAAAETLRARSFLIDGEAVACDGDGLPVFDRLRYRRQDGRVFLYAFDLLELNGRDMRREPLEVRKSAELNICSVAICWGLRRITHPAKTVSGVTFYPGLVRRAGFPRWFHHCGRGRPTARVAAITAQSPRAEAFLTQASAGTGAWHRICNFRLIRCRMTA
jgi:hypothetical protein